MNATTYGPAEQGWQDPEGETRGELPGRPRRKLLTPWSAGLCAVILGAAGFFIGVKVEKGQLASSSTGAASSLAARFAGATSRSTASGSSASGSSASGSSASRPAGGFGGYGGGFGAGSGATVGTVASVNGRTVYVTETSGNTVKVTLSSATKITKAQTVGRSKINPGDSVVVAGVSGSKGAISATSLTDSGARASSTSSSSSSGSASSGSSSSVSSLFGG